MSHDIRVKVVSTRGIISAITPSGLRWLTENMTEESPITVAKEYLEELIGLMKSDGLTVEGE